MTLSIMFFVALSIDTQYRYQYTLSIECCYAEGHIFYCYTEYHYANVVILNIVAPWFCSHQNNNDSKGKKGNSYNPDKIFF
jgi:hypothetical protein